MKQYDIDTAKEYDDMVGFIAKESIEPSLAEFVGDVDDYKPTVKPKSINPEFPEQWQSLFVNFKCFDDYKDFMLKLGQVPLPKLKELVFTSTPDSTSLDNFFGD